MKRLKLGISQPARSKFNSPIFAVAKKNGGICLVQDFRALSANMHTHKYFMKYVSECIGDISWSGSNILITIEISFKPEEPVYVKQFKISITECKEVEKLSLNGSS
jgi:hypothetical protein